jgi:hypothetical protein
MQTLRSSMASLISGQVKLLVTEFSGGAAHGFTGSTV